MRWARAGALVALASLVALPFRAGAAECADNVADLRDPDTTLRFTVEVMETDEGRAKGLMYRESLPKFSGMLFVYDKAQPVAFWMRNTLIPLDMLFFDDQGKLARIKSNAQPLDETPVVGGDSIRYVLEINGGLAEALGIDLGAELRNPALENPAWACSG